MTTAIEVTLDISLDTIVGSLEDIIEAVKLQSYALDQTDFIVSGHFRAAQIAKLDEAEQLIKSVISSLI